MPLFNPPPAAGAGNVTSGTTTVNFGATASEVNDTHKVVTVTGQTGILSTSVVLARVRAVASADHNIDEHMVEQLKIEAGNIQPGVGFDITAICYGWGKTYGVFNLNWSWS